MSRGSLKHTPLSCRASCGTSPPKGLRRHFAAPFLVSIELYSSHLVPLLISLCPKSLCTLPHLAGLELCICTRYAQRNGIRALTVAEGHIKARLLQLKNHEGSQP